MKNEEDFINLWELTVKHMNNCITNAKFKAPPAEIAWMEWAGGRTLPMKKIWKQKCHFCTPRDTQTKMKVTHRNLFVQREEKCLACGRCDERQEHFAVCEVLWDEFWTYMVDLIKDTGMEVSASRDLDLMVLLGRLNDEEVVEEEAYGIVTIAWRQLYRENVSAREENRRPNWRGAAKRTIAQLINRQKAVGEKWWKWMQSIKHTSRVQVFPAKFRKRKLMETSAEAEYLSVKNS